MGSGPWREHAIVCSADIRHHVGCRACPPGLQKSATGTPPRSFTTASASNGVMVTLARMVCESIAVCREQKRSLLAPLASRRKSAGYDAPQTPSKTPAVSAGLWPLSDVRNAGLRTSLPTPTTRRRGRGAGPLRAGLGHACRPALRIFLAHHSRAVAHGHRILRRLQTRTAPTRPGVTLTLGAPRWARESQERQCIAALRTARWHFRTKAKRCVGGRFVSGILNGAKLSVAKMQNFASADKKIKYPDSPLPGRCPG